MQNVVKHQQQRMSQGLQAGGFNPIENMLVKLEHLPR